MLAFLSVDARTGIVNTYLPDLALSGPIAATIGRYESATLTLPLPDVLRTWNGATPTIAQYAALQDYRSSTRPGQSVIIACDTDVADAAGRPLPIWGGLVISRQTDASSGVTLNTATLEAYLDRRFGGNYTCTNRRQDLIVADLVGQFVADGTLPGVPIRVANTASAVSRNRTYNDTDDKSVYQLLTDLANLDQPIEWTIGCEWQATTPRKITPVLYVADRVGSPAQGGMAPTAVFNMPGCVTGVSFIESYDSGKGANRVTATGQSSQNNAGQTVRPQSTVPTVIGTASTGGRPVFDFRWSPSTTITDVATLTSHATLAYALLHNGQTALTVAASVWEAPVYGQDWQLGDDVAYDLAAPAYLDGWLSDNVPARGTSRVMGWQRDDQTISPVLLGGDISVPVSTQASS